ncbi:MAG: ATP-binding cassette domain-containing protein [Bergeyella sp.]
MSIIQIDSISKSFGGKTILQDVFLQCKTGEIAGILGRNGSGKSTLFQIVTCALKAGHKFVKIDEKLIRSSFDTLGNINYLPQFHFLPSHLKIKTSLSAYVSGDNREKLFENPHISPFLNAKPKELSGGELRIIEVLMLIYSSSKFTILDEPFHSLSPKVTEEIKLSIKENLPDKGFIISDHQYNHITELSDALYLLSETSLKLVKDRSDLKFYGYINF